MGKIKDYYLENIHILQVDKTKILNLSFHSWVMLPGKMPVKKYRFNKDTMDGLRNINKLLGYYRVLLKGLYK